MNWEKCNKNQIREKGEVQNRKGKSLQVSPIWISLPLTFFDALSRFSFAFPLCVCACVCMWHLTSLELAIKCSLE